MKRFLVFSFPHYYPRGGLDDLFGMADTREEAEAIATSDSRWKGPETTTEIVDTETDPRLKG